MCLQQSNINIKILQLCIFYENEKSYHKSITFLNNSNFVVFKWREFLRSRTDQFDEIKIEKKNGWSCKLITWSGNKIRKFTKNWIDQCSSWETRVKVHALNIDVYVKCWYNDLNKNVVISRADTRKRWIKLIPKHRIKFYWEVRGAAWDMSYGSMDALRRLSPNFPVVLRTSWYIRLNGFPQSKFPSYKWDFLARYEILSRNGTSLPAIIFVGSWLYRSAYYLLYRTVIMPDWPQMSKPLTVNHPLQLPYGLMFDL